MAKIATKQEQTTKASTTQLFSQPVAELERVGKAYSSKLEKLHIKTIGDLLFHLPLRYENHTCIHPIDKITVGQNLCIQGAIHNSRYHPKALSLSVRDDSGEITILFYHFNPQQHRSLAEGKIIRCFGTIREGRQSGCFEMAHPEYRLLDDPDKAPLEKTLTPIYPNTEGLTQQKLRQWTGHALKLLDDVNPEEFELLPMRWFEKPSIMSLADALRYVHRPPADADMAALLESSTIAQKRLSYEEMLTHCLSLRYIRSQCQARKAPRLQVNSARVKHLLAELPFELTAAQQRTWTEVRRDLAQSVPMMRLLQGDVGSGKTVIAALGALQAMDNNWQVALLAPTELLASQHHHNLSSILKSSDLPVRLLTGKMRASERKKLHAEMAEKKPLLVIGTHALFQEGVEFARLGMVIIDEQHRFGVQQRMQLLEKGNINQYFPHQLVMTATPIPRTLTMIVAAELDCSTIDELPPGRQPVNTALISSDRRDEIINRLSVACTEEQRQAYWICTLIEQSDTLDCQPAIDTCKELRERLPELKIGLVHGRLPPAEKEQEMNRFRQGDYQVLVATTVIEVGVDVPNSSLMIIDNAERLGLAQLHQLRGRVGRGSRKSDCVLLYQEPLSELSKQRLKIIRESNDGFAIAEKDLELRGSGELLGRRQTGHMEMKIADLVRDRDMLPHIAKTVRQILAEEPGLMEPLARRWLGKDAEFSNL